MAGKHAFRFGVIVNGTASREEWIAKVRRVEALGYATLLMIDHFTAGFPPVPALMSAADATERLRIGSWVFCNDYHHPVILAKDVAALDVLSEGRFELGIGAGWMQSEYEQAGIAYDSNGVRIERLQESLAILKGLFTGEAFTFSGKHYAIKDLKGLPQPVQQPHPPIFIGGGGKRVLSLAAREADIVGIAPIMRVGRGWQDMTDGTEEATRRKIAWIHQAAEGRHEAPELNISVYVVVVTEQRQQVASGIAQRVGLSQEEVLRSPHCLVGTTEQIVESLYQRREQYGISYITIWEKDMEAFAPFVARLTGK